MSLRDQIAGLLRQALGLDRNRRAVIADELFLAIAAPHKARRLEQLRSAASGKADNADHKTTGTYFERRASTMRRRDIRAIKDGLIRVVRSIDKSAAPNPTPAEISDCFRRIEAKFGTEVALQVARDTLAGAKRRGFLKLPY